MGYNRMIPATILAPNVNICKIVMAKTHPINHPFCFMSTVTDAQIEKGKFNVTAVPKGFLIEKCPAPFLRDPLAVAGTTETLDDKFCRFGCCIPCPAQNLVCDRENELQTLPYNNSKIRTK